MDVARTQATPSPQLRPQSAGSTLLGDPCPLDSYRASGAAPSGWTPTSLHGVSSVRRPGMLPAAWDAFRGTPERPDGQALTAVQIDQLTPFLSAGFNLPETQVRDHLTQVRLLLGGPAAHTPWNAVTIGHDIYVRSDEELSSIEGWEQRRWLAHECGHVMQYARTPESDDDTHRVRSYLGAYVGHLFVGPHWGPGAIATGLARWLAPSAPGEPHDTLVNAIHDTHVMEAEAERSAQAFASSTQAPLLA